LAEVLNPNLSGLGLRLHYDSNFFSNVTLSNVLVISKVSTQAGLPSTGITGAPAGTNTVGLVGWANISAAWPGTLPVTLYTVDFTVSPTATGRSQLGFTASSTAAGYSFTSPLVSVSAVPVPASVWLMLSTLTGLFFVSRLRRDTDSGQMTHGMA